MPRNAVTSAGFTFLVSMITLVWAFGQLLGNPWLVLGVATGVSGAFAVIAYVYERGRRDH